MLYIEPKSTDAAFHFSCEEYIMREFNLSEPVMMIWQTGNCVMLGCNQIAQAEIDTTYAAKEGMQIVRRASGGGTIFTDMGTLLFTVILPFAEGADPLESVREKVAAPIVKALNEMGVPAKIQGRNDILVDGKKVSGVAQYAIGSAICTHGSILYDADLDNLERVLNVDDDKIRSKALPSVRSRVTNIKEHMPEPLPTLKFWERLKAHLFNELQIRCYNLTDNDLVQINQIYRDKYANPSWTYGRAPKFSFHAGKRFPGGKVEVYLDIGKGVVTSCTIRGDFLGVAPICGLEKLLENRLFRQEDFEDALKDTALELYLGSITKDELLSCIF